MANSIDGFDLPDSLVWVDEFTTSQLAQNTQRSITGAMIYQRGVKVHGQEMTLAGDETWMTYANVKQLKTMLDSPQESFALVYRDVAYNVIPDTSSGAAMVATPVIDYSEPSDDDMYVVSFKFLTV